MATKAGNAVYYPSWKVYSGFAPSKLQVEAITHVFYAFARVNEDGTLRFNDEWADDQMEVDGDKGCLRALAKLKRQHPRLKTLLSIGGGGQSVEFPAVAANAHSRQVFARSVREWVDKYFFDGVDVDWEHPTTPKQGADYLHLLHTLRSALPSPTYLITIALPAGPWCLRNINLASAAHVLDLLNLMGYDFTGPWTSLSGHHAQLTHPSGTDQTSCHSGFDHVIRGGFPSHKILLGIPVYARAFPGSSGIGQPFRKEDATEIDYVDLPADWVRDAIVDETLVAASVVDPGGKGFVSFDVPATVRMKIKYALRMKLGGVFYWTGAGDRQGNESLVKAAWDIMNDYEVGC